MEIIYWPRMLFYLFVASFSACLLTVFSYFQDFKNQLLFLTLFPFRLCRENPNTAIFLIISGPRRLWLIILFSSDLRKANKCNGLSYDARCTMHAHSQQHYDSRSLSLSLSCTCFLCSLWTTRKAKKEITKNERGSQKLDLSIEILKYKVCSLIGFCFTFDDGLWTKLIVGNFRNAFKWMKTLATYELSSVEPRCIGLCSSCCDKWRLNLWDRVLKLSNFFFPFSIGIKGTQIGLFDGIDTRKKKKQ